MSGVISFGASPRQIWIVANWAFRQLLEDIKSSHPEDTEMIRECDASEAISGLLIYELERKLQIRMTQAIKQVASDVISGIIQSGLQNKPYGDVRAATQYREALAELLEIVPPTTQP